MHPRGARDFFDALVALGLLQRRNGRYANTEQTDWFLDRGKPSYIGSLLEMADRRLYPAWGALTAALKTGEPQDAGMAENSSDEKFAALSADPEKLRGFLRAMTGISLATTAGLVEKFPWRDYRNFCDVGSAEGALAVRLARAYPHLSGGGFDLPAVRTHFESYVRAQGLHSRLRFHAGDFFRDALPQADVLIMGHILHDWDLPEKKLLLRKAWQALPRGGALVVYEALIDDEREQNTFGLLMSLNMLLETRGGFDFSGADCMAWMKAAGFTQSCVEPLTATHSMVIGIK